MNDYHAPADVRGQIQHLVVSFRAALGERLVGLYLHGSLAMGCFNPARSDLDLLALISRPLRSDEKRAIATALLRYSNQPRPVEISFIKQAALQNWQHPCAFEFHYSEDWREKVTEEMSSGTGLFAPQALMHDEDLAGHLVIIRRRGITLYGQPIQTAIPDIPLADYRASIVADFHWARQRLQEIPTYTVLNMCRVLAFVEEGHVFSKAEGGAWGLAHLPAAHHPVIQRALDHYTSAADTAAFDPVALQACAQEMLARLG